MLTSPSTSSPTHPNKSARSNGWGAGSGASRGYQEVEQKLKHLRMELGKAPAAAASHLSDRSRGSVGGLVHVGTPLEASQKVPYSTKQRGTDMQMYAAQPMAVADVATHQTFHGKGPSSSAAHTQEPPHVAQNRAHLLSQPSKGIGESLHACTHPPAQDAQEKKGKALQAGAQHFEGFIASHLPPVTLTCCLPPTYPAESAPEVDVQCTWVAGDTLVTFQDRLQGLWSEQGGGNGVCVEMVEVVREELLEAATRKLEEAERKLWKLEEKLGEGEGRVLDLWRGWGQEQQQQQQQLQLQLQSGLYQQQDRVGGQQTLHSAHSKTGSRSLYNISNGNQQPRSQVEKQLQQQQSSYLQSDTTSTNCSAAMQCATPHLSDEQRQPRVPLPRANSPVGSTIQHPTGGGIDQIVLQYRKNVELYRALQHHNTQQSKVSFLEGYHTCETCLEDVPGHEMEVFVDCHHMQCRTCLARMVQIHINESSVLALKCHNCSERLHPQNVRSVCSREEGDKYEERLLSSAIDGMGDILYCPRCNTACVDEKEGMAHCFKCLLVFCTNCFEQYHPGKRCSDFSHKIQNLVDRATKAEGLQAGEVQSLIDKLRAERDTKQYLQKATMSCPHCRVAIEKNGGCSHVVCTQCQTHLCYRCGKNITKEGYDHFTWGGCGLFEDVAANEIFYEYHAQADVRQQRLWAVEQMFGAQRFTACPYCGFQCLKDNPNNHIRCPCCSNHFCFLCRLRLPTRGGGRHFAESQCKQHTPI